MGRGAGPGARGLPWALPQDPQRTLGAQAKPVRCATEAKPAMLDRGISYPFRGPGVISTHLCGYDTQTLLFSARRFFWGGPQNLIVFKCSCTAGAVPCPHWRRFRAAAPGLSSMVTKWVTGLGRSAPASPPLTESPRDPAWGFAVCGPSQCQARYPVPDEREHSLDKRSIRHGSLLLLRCVCVCYFALTFA